MKSRQVFIAVWLASVVTLTGCGQQGFTGIYNAPLPGGADLGPAPYRVTAQFADVLDLVPQASVKVNDVAVGRVSAIGMAPDGWTAEVTMEVNRNVHLPANADAQLRQSSLLGEKYVQLDSPQTGQRGRLADGAYIPISKTNRNPQVEEVLGALSMVLNGGGIGQLQNINQELNAALSGKETDIRALNQNMERFTSSLDGQKGDIVRAIDGLNRLSGSLAAQRGNIAFSLDNLGPGLKVINEQRGQLVAMLQSMHRLSDVAVGTINRSKADTVANLQALSPTLQKLAEAGDSLPKSLEVLATFPFTDYTANAIKGDYTNLDAQIDLDFSSVVRDLVAKQPPPPAPGALPGSQPSLPLPGPPGALPPVPAPPPPPAPIPGGAGWLDGLIGGGQ